MQQRPNGPTGLVAQHGLQPPNQEGSPLSAMQAIIEERNLLRSYSEATKNENIRLRSALETLQNELGRCQRDRDYYMRMASELQGSLQDLNNIIVARVANMNTNLQRGQQPEAPTPQIADQTPEGIAARFAPEGGANA